VVGAYGEDSHATGVDGDGGDNSYTDSGAAYVFVRSGTTWSQQAYLKASNTWAYDGFGEAVSVSGNKLVVGASAEDSNATGVDGNQLNDLDPDSGTAYVFVRNGSTWSQAAYLKASNTGTGDQFGVAVGISGDTLVVGAQGEDSNATGVDGNQTDDSAGESGAAYVFDLEAIPTPYCFGDGSGTLCPCTNIGTQGNGCASSVSSSGANLTGTGFAGIGMDMFVLSGTGMPNSSALYFQGTAQVSAGLGVPFGDGLRCVGGTIVRLGTEINVTGISRYPAGNDASVSVKGHITSPGMRTYQCWYRNAAAFCTASTFNLTNAVRVTWVP
jgi:hypothetical protein